MQLSGSPRTLAASTSPASPLTPQPSSAWPSACHAVRRNMLFAEAGVATGEAHTGSGRSLRAARLEAILFLAREPLPTRKLSQFANLADGTEARTLIRQLNQWYDTHGCAFRVEQTAGGYRLLTRPKFANWVRRLAHVPEETRLSSVAMETLALVAYRQPILRADIEAIRGVSCGEILRQLMERDLVRICGRSEELGRPYLYGTTKPFLLLFGLKSLDDLPRSDQLRGEGLPSTTSTTEALAAGQDPETADTPDSDSLENATPKTGHQQEENLVTTTATLEPTSTQEDLERLPAGVAALDSVPRADYDEDDDLDDDDLDDDDDDDDEDDFDDFDDDDLDDDDEDDDDLDDEEEDDDDDDFDDWEEVDDDDEDDDDDDEWDDDDDEEDDDDWDDDDDEEDDEDWDDDEEEEDESSHSP